MVPSPLARPLCCLWSQPNAVTAGRRWFSDPREAGARLQEAGDHGHSGGLGQAPVGPGGVAATRHVALQGNIVLDREPQATEWALVGTRDGERSGEGRVGHAATSNAPTVALIEASSRAMKPSLAPWLP